MMNSTLSGSGLLVSVRDTAEAELACQANVDLIDIKEPSRGPLGMAEPETVMAIQEAVAGRTPLSAALGEWSNDAITTAHWHLKLGLPFLKWGLAGYPTAPGWGEDLLETRRQVPHGTEVVCVAYADALNAKCPPVAEIVKFAKRFRYRVFLFDTFLKDGKSLLDHLSLEELGQHMESLQRSKIAVAVGGSLKLEHVPKLLPLQPSWLAVRGAVCVGGGRDATLDPVRLKKWREAIPQQL